MNLHLSDVSALGKRAIQYLHQVDVTALLVRNDEVSQIVPAAMNRDATISVSSLRKLTEAEVREVIEEKLRAEFGESMQEWRFRGGITSAEAEADTVAVLVLRGIHPSNFVGDAGDAPHPIGRY